MSLSVTDPTYSVCVVIPAYNAEKYVGRAVESVLAQSRPADEIIVVDDGSTDGTSGAVKRFGVKVKYIRQENIGASSARNTGIKASRSEWIAFLDADDEWLPEKLKVQVAHLRWNNHLVWTNSDFFRDFGRYEPRKQARDANMAEAILEGKEYFDSYFLAYQAGFYACTPTMIIKKQALEEVGLFRVGQLRANDTDLWFRMAYRWPQIGYVSQPLVVVHLETPESITKRYDQFSVRCELVERHLKLSAELGQLEQFRPCAVQMLQRVIRDMVILRRGAETTAALEQFDDLLDRRFKREMRFRTSWPRLGALLVKVLSMMKKPFRSKG
ncbi:glycosyltransferase family 2 protein [Planctomycetota bacterium]